MSEAEHIREILKRVFADLKKRYSENLGWCPLDRERDASTISASLPVEGERLDGKSTS